MLCIYTLVSFLRLKRMLEESIPCGENVFENDSVSSPFIFGMIHPRIYLPSSLGEEESEYVLAHERTHLRRGDHLWKPAGVLCVIVHWMNPLVWLGFRCFLKDVELACDEAVISGRDLSYKKQYSYALVKCSMHGKTVLSCPLAFGELGVKQRVTNILSYRKPSGWVIVAALAGCAVFALCFLTSPKRDELDLSFLNYKNAVSLIGQNGLDYVINYPPGKSVIQIGSAEARDVIQYFENASWRERRPLTGLSSPGSIQFVITDSCRITVYQNPRVACVHFEGENRYYRIHVDDYEKAVALFHLASVNQLSDNWQASSFSGEGYQGVLYGVRQYAPFCAVDRSAQGIQIGIVDGDENNQLFEFAGFSSEEWIISCYHSGLMDNGMLMKEVNVTDVPDGLRSEYSWNWLSASVPYGSYTMNDWVYLVLSPGETGTEFLFQFNPLLSYLYIGTVEENNGRLICTTSDGLYRYCFEITDSGTLVFDADSSSEARTYDNSILGNGTEFHYSYFPAADLASAVSDIYSEEEIMAAMLATYEFFQREFPGCALTKLSYAGDEEVRRYQEGEQEEVIVLLSDFETDDFGGDGSLNPNSIYENWSWILSRNGEGWQVKDYGY